MDYKFLSDMGVLYFPDARGFIVIYEVPAQEKLEAHPESNVEESQSVVSIPVDAKVVGIFKIPKDFKFDETSGLPIH